MLDKLIKTCLSIPLFMRIMLKNREQQISFVICDVIHI